ncbi:hypothetical protein I4U23_023094 [Adineta vaga]|nr:hypothetical protein I4U23_023094 [Adineta vaga]
MKLIVFLQLIVTICAFAPVHFQISSIGNQFQAANMIELLAVISNIQTTIRCANLCYQNSLCRTFDYDFNSRKCRLFEGSIDTGIILSLRSTSVVGEITVDQSSYSFYNTSSNNCVNSRFLKSNTTIGLCQCPMHTVWNGSKCINQRYVGKRCADHNWCRMDLNLSCASLMCVVDGSSSSITSSTTTLLTVIPPCPPQPISNQTLLYLFNPTTSIYPAYNCYAYTWIATGPSATLSFFFRHDPGGWMIDDVNVYHGSTQMIINGGFETGSLTGWTRKGNCNLNIGQVYSGSTYAKSGNYYYYDPCAGMNMGDTLQQTFSTIMGDTYVISYWLTNYGCCNATTIANISLY